MSAFSQLYNAFGGGGTQTQVGNVYGGPAQPDPELQQNPNMLAPQSGQTAGASPFEQMLSMFHRDQQQQPAQLVQPPQPALETLQDPNAPGMPGAPKQTGLLSSLAKMFAGGM